MNKYTHLLFCLLLSFSIVSSAQEKIIIGVIPATNEGYSARSEELQAITEAVMNAFSKTKRFTVVDRTNMAAVNNEMKLQRSENFIDGKTVAQGKSLGAQYLISITTSSYINDGTVCKFVLHLNLIDVSTGQIANDEVINVKGGGHGKTIAGAVGGATLGHFTGLGAGTGALAGSRAGGATNKDKALGKALQDIEDEIDDFVTNNFPVYFSIAQISEKDVNGNAKKILIAGGSNFGLRKGDKLKVIQLSEMDVDGKKLTRKTEVAMLKISKVEDENFSICEVLDENNNIVALFEGKQKLKVVTVNE